MMHFQGRPTGFPFSEDLRGDRQLVLAAVGENGLALRHAAQAPGDGAWSVVMTHWEIQ